MLAPLVIGRGAVKLFQGANCGKDIAALLPLADGGALLRVVVNAVEHKKPAVKRLLSLRPAPSGRHNIQ